MKAAQLQAELKALGFYADDIDGLIGPKSRAAIDALLEANGVGGWKGWSSERRLVAAKQVLFRKAGIDTGAIDGLLGTQTRYAESVWDARKAEGKTPSSEETWRDAEPAVPLSKAPTYQWPRQSGVSAFFGPVGSNQTSLTVPYPLRIAWNLSQVVTRVSCHKKVAEPAERVLKAVLDHYGLAEIKRLRLDLFGGCLNVRKMRGGSSWSMHAWGIAFDFDPERNQLKWGRDRAAFARPEYKFWFEAWEREGAVSLGRTQNFDWMHTQFARI